MDYTNMSSVSLRELLETNDAQITSLKRDAKSLRKAIESNEGDGKEASQAEELSQINDAIEIIEKENSKVSEEIIKKETNLQAIKRSSLQSQAIETVKEEKTRSSREQAFAESPRAKELFMDAISKSTRSGNLIWDEYQDLVRSEGFAGDLTGLLPKTVLDEINDLIEGEGFLLPFIKRVTGITSLTLNYNLSEELGRGHAGASAPKVEQSNTLDTKTINSQYIYKYIKVPRELLDAPSNVLYDYVLKELAQRLILTIEHAIISGAGTTGIDQIISITSMTDTNFVTSITGTPTEDLLMDSGVEILGTAGLIHIMNKKNF